MDFSPRDDFSVLSELKHLKAVRAHGLALPDSFLINAGANGTLEELCLSSPRFSIDAISTFVKMNKNISQLKWTDAANLATCMHEFSALTHMKKMSLYSSKLSDDGLIALKDMHDLVFLDMSNNSIHGDGLQHITGCKMLRQLSLNKNHIEGQHLSYIAPLRSLECLTLDYNPIDDDGVQHLAELTNLKLLGLRDTNITDRCIPSLGRLSNLKSIYISRTLISESGIEKLCHMLQKVSIIGVSQKQLTAESVARLKNQFPKVYFDM
jgi:Leucine-rich repeat (LRR) protein